MIFFCEYYVTLSVVLFSVWRTVEISTDDGHFLPTYIVTCSNPTILYYYRTRKVVYNSSYRRCVPVLLIGRKTSARFLSLTHPYQNVISCRPVN